MCSINAKAYKVYVLINNWITSK